MANYKFKVSIVGDGRVGKTSLIKSYTNSEFSEDYIKTIGAQFSKYDQKINGDQCELYFWDIAGQDEFHFLALIHLALIIRILSPCLALQ